MRDRALGVTIEFIFSTHNPDGGGVLVAPSSALVPADFAIYKNGSATVKTTTNGITVTSPFGSVTGQHKISIDTSNNTGDAGFWASGSVYSVKLTTAKTAATYSLNGQPVLEFSLELQTADVRKFGGVAGTFAAGIPDAKIASIAANAINAASIADGAIDTATFAAGTTIPRVTLADTVTTNTDMRGTDGANTVAPTNLSAAQVTTAVLASQLTEAYAADGVAPTLTQAVMLILQHLSESSIVSTTKTVKKLDRTTSAATFTLDSATDPTSITRTT